MVHVIKHLFKSRALNSLIFCSRKMQESAGYPSASTRLSQHVKKKLLDLPNVDKPEKMNLAWFKDNIWSSVQDFQIPGDQVICGMQANIFKILLKDGDGNVKSVIGKRVVPNELPAKANQDLWQDFLKSVERETLFYRDKSQLNPDLFPKVYYSNGYTDQEDIMQSYYLIIMDDVSNDYFQDTGMNKVQAEHLMKALAKFHATHWRKIDANADRGSFWVLSRRQPLGEIENADETWKALLDRFPQFKQLFDGVEDIGARLAGKAEYLDNFVNDRLITQIHGDCKGWNLFFAKDPNSKVSPVLFIDLQWTGIGHPFQDVAYALTTSLNADLLPQMEAFVDLYVEHLQIELPNEDIKMMRKDFDIIWLDYARVIITGLWKRLTPENMVKNQSIVGPSFIGRSLAHAEFITKKINTLLKDLKIQ